MLGGVLSKVLHVVNGLVSVLLPVPSHHQNNVSLVTSSPASNQMSVNVNYEECESPDVAYSRLVEVYENLSIRSVYDLIKQNPMETVVTSMFPAICNLGILALHADGRTKEELFEILQLKNRKEVEYSLKKLMKQFDSKFSLKIYVRCDRPFNETFVRDYENICGAEVGYIDYTNDDEAYQAINLWMNSQICKPCKQTIDPDKLCSDRGIYSVSTHEFLVKWDNEPPFKIQNFQISEEKCIQVATLYGDRLIKYANIEKLDAQFIDLPINKNCFVRLIAPNTVHGLPEVMKSLQCSETYNAAVDQMKEKRVMIYAPLGEITRQSDQMKILQDEFKNITIFDPENSELDTVCKDGENVFVCSMVHCTNLIGSKQLLNDNKEVNVSLTTPTTGTASCKECSCNLPEVRVKYPFVYIIFKKDVEKKDIIGLIGTYYGNA